MSEGFAYANWLNSKDPSLGAQPIRVQMGKHTFEGVFYKYVGTYGPNERAVTEGPRKAGDERISYRMSLLGVRPKWLQKDKDVLTYWHEFPIDEEAYEKIGEWYVSGYYEEFGKQPAYDQHHFGNHFELCECTPMKFGYYAGWRIDAHEKERKRRAIQVEFLSERSKAPAGLCLQVVSP